MRNDKNDRIRLQFIHKSFFHFSDDHRYNPASYFNFNAYPLNVINDQCHHKSSNADPGGHSLKDISQRKKCAKNHDREKGVGELINRIF